MEAMMIHIQPFFDWLAQTTLIASVVICLILLIQRILGAKLGPRWSHALWLVLLMRMVLPWAPSSPLSLSNLIPSWDRPIQSQQSPGTVEVQETSLPTQTAETPEVTPGPEPQSEGAVEMPVAPRPRTPANAEGHAWRGWVSIRRVLPVLWLAGAIVIGVYLIASDLALWRIVKRDRPLLNQSMLELFEECKAQMGVQSLVVVVPSERARSPGLFGFVRPRLLLPRQMLDTATRQEMRYVFLHELAHLRRHDIYLGWLASLLQVLHWFNPLVWFAFYRMRADRELACDALVLTRTGQDKSQEYGGTILGLVRRFSRSRPLPAMAGVIESKSQLKRRIAMITQFKNNSYRFSPLAAVLVAILACISLPDARQTKASEISGVKPVGLGSNAQRTGLVVREVKIKQGESGLSLSRDGKQLAYPKRKDGTTNLVVRDLASGEETQITKYETGTARYPVFSPDGKEIVYTLTQGMRDQKLHIVSLETGEDRDLGQYGFAQDWSKDGRFILFSPWQEEDKQTTYDMLVVSEGTVKELNVPISRSVMGPPRVSPDAKYISYSHQGNVYLYHVDNGDVVRITQRPAAYQPLWSLDGKMLFFISPQAFGPEADLCGVSIVDGKAVGGVQIIKPDFGDYVNLFSLSDAGRLLYRQIHFEAHSYSTEVDPQTNQPIGKPVKLVDGERATWSPDGKRIAYISGALHVMSADGSNDRKIVKVNPFKGPYAWAPDNDHIYMVERVEDRAGIYSISMSAKEARPVFLDPDIMGHVTCSPDGKRLAFLKLPASSEKSEIFTVNVDGTNLRQLTSDDNASVIYPAWSPDGKYIAFGSKRQGEDMRAIRAVSVDDGTTRDLFQGETPQDQFYWVSWSPDGSKIVWTSSSEIRIGQVSDGTYDTFRVDIGAPARSTFHMPRLSPDGKTILFSTWANVQHLMLLENFLPQSTAGK